MVYELQSNFSLAAMYDFNSFNCRRHHSKYSEVGSFFSSMCCPEHLNKRSRGDTIFTRNSSMHNDGIMHKHNTIVL